MFAANIGAIVGIQVLNKTSEEYWFLVKFNLSLLNGNMDLRNIKKKKAYFLIRLQIDLRLETLYLEYRTLFLLNLVARALFPGFAGVAGKGPPPKPGKRALETTLVPADKKILTTRPIKVFEVTEHYCTPPSQIDASSLINAPVTMLCLY